MKKILYSNIKCIASKQSKSKFLSITESCFRQMTWLLNDTQFERGGIIGSGTSLYDVTHFFPDLSCCCSDSTYKPNTEELNKQINTWAGDGICFMGIVHSHTNGNDTLSIGDKKFIVLQLSEFTNLPFMWFPLFTRNECQTKLVFYQCSLNNNKLEIKRYDETKIIT